MNVSLPDELRAFVEEQVRAGTYGSTSEYVRELIRRDRDRQKLREILLDGARSPVSRRADTEYFDELRAGLDEQDLPGLRCWRLETVPYLVFYLDSGETVDVWRVLHAHRDIPASLA